MLVFGILVGCLHHYRCLHCKPWRNFLMATLYTQNCSPDPPFKAIFFFMALLKSQQLPYLIKNEPLLGINKTWIRSIPAYGKWSNLLNFRCPSGGCLMDKKHLKERGIYSCNCNKQDKIDTVCFWTKSSVSVFAEMPTSGDSISFTTAPPNRMSINHSYYFLDLNTKKRFLKSHYQLFLSLFIWNWNNIKYIHTLL